MLSDRESTCLCYTGGRPRRIDCLSMSRLLPTPFEPPRRCSGVSVPGTHASLRVHREPPRATGTTTEPGPRHRQRGRANDVARSRCIARLRATGYDGSRFWKVSRDRKHAHYMAQDSRPPLQPVRARVPRVQLIVATFFRNHCTVFQRHGTH